MRSHSHGYEQYENKIKYGAQSKMLARYILGRPIVIAFRVHIKKQRGPMKKKVVQGRVGVEKGGAGWLKQSTSSHGPSMYLLIVNGAIIDRNPLSVQVV